MKHWPLYLKLQSELAYREGLGTLPQVASVHHTGAREHLGAKGDLLIVGPGGPGEIESLKLPGWTTALTAHEPEAEAIRSALPDVNVAVGDMHEMPFRNDSYDRLFASNVLEHALAPYVALLECRRVMPYGGRAYFVMPDFAGVEGGRGPFHLHCLTREVWEELMRKTGFVVSRVDKVIGAEDPSYAYYEYRCQACDPPDPHHRMLAALRTRHGDT
jgi:SAM-dependent methyltransferase